MAQKRRFGLPFTILLLGCLGAAWAQSQPSRLAGDWRSSGMVALAGSQPPLSTTGSDEGAAPADEMLNRMLLLLKPSAEQQQALATELTNLQNPSSPVYHHWLTPAAFASTYSNSAADVAAVAAWLTSEGFQVEPLPAGRGWIEFSGTVTQAEDAFRIKIDNITTASGETRAVAMGEISVPAALEPVIAGLVSLDGAVSTPALTAPEPVGVSAAALAAETSPGGADALTPQMIAKLIDLNGLAAKGEEGAGQNIAIVTRSDVNSEDVAAFRAAFGLPSSPLTVIPDGADPGLTDGQAEATLAASWAGAASPEATIVLVPATTTNATDGVDLSLAEIVDQDLATAAVVGYSSCEAGLSLAHQGFYAAAYQQAAAEGMAVIAAAGDSGAAACYVAGSTAPVKTGYAVNALASTPWDTAVGVASFGSSGPGAGNQALAAWSPLNAADPAYAGGGGSSTVYAIPSWQPIPAQLPAGVSNTNRFLPDLSLPTAIDTGANPGLAFCLSASAATSTGCTLVRSGGSAAAASIFAGIGALIDAEHGTQGNLTPGLYALTTQSGVFTDVVQGSSQLECAADSPGCDAEGQIGYSAAAGYDLATGLGVPDAQTLVTAFGNSPATGTNPATVTLSAPLQTCTNNPSQPYCYNPSASIGLEATVTGTAGVTPTGFVEFCNQTTTVCTQGYQLNSSGTATYNWTGGLATGTNDMVAEYQGDQTYAPVNSAAVGVYAEASTTSLAITAPSSVTPGETISATVTLTVGTPPAGTVAPAGNVTLAVDGNAAAPYTAALVSGTTATFPTVVIPANTTVTSHTLLASYAGNTDYEGSTSSTVTVPVVAVTPTVTVTPATTSPAPGSSLQVIVAVAPPQAGEVTPTGSVSLVLDGVTSEGTEPLTNGSATFTFTAPATGSHTLVATYTPDAASTNFYTTATSPPAAFTIALIPTTATNNATTTTPSLGSSVTVNTTIAPSTGSSYYSGGDPSGTVTYTLDGTPLPGSPATVIPGTPSTASTTFTVSTAGTHTLSATYSGDTHYAASSAVTVFTVSKLGTTMTVTAAPTSAPVGSPLVAEAIITPTTASSVSPSGSVNFTLGGTVVGTGTVTNGVATATLTVPSAGSLTLEATYAGDTNFTGSTATTSVTGTKATPTVTVTPSSYAPAAGSSLTLTATVGLSGVSGVTPPTGTVNFYLGSTLEGSAGVSSGTATLTITAPAIGTYSLTATYSGDSNYTGPITSSPVPITVTKGNTTLAVTLSSTSPAPNSTIVVTATITATVTGSTVPTGTVSFTMDGQSIGSGQVIGGTTATTTATAPASGTHTIIAIYSGDANFNGSTSPSVLFTVAKTATDTQVVPSTTTPALGAALPVTIDVASLVPGLTTQPTGYVSVTVDGASAGLATLTPGSPSTASFTIPAQFLTPGTHTIGGTYSGDSYYATSTAAGVQITVPKISTTLLVSAPTASLTAGSTLTVTAQLTGASAGPAEPSGTVTFYLDGASVATSAVVPTSPDTATATGTILSLPAGSHILTATYTNDPYYANATSPAVPITVAKSPTTITISPSTLTPTAGGSMIVTADVLAVTASGQGTIWPSGTVTITMDGVAVATGQLSPGNPSIANVTVPLVSAGTHVLGATYAGDSNYSGSSTTQTVTITAAKGSTTTTATATPASLTSGTPETLTATIAPVNAVTGVTYTITGSVSFYDTPKSTGVQTLLGTAPVGSGNTATLSGVTLASNISHSITAVYSGDANWLGSTSPILPLAATTLPDVVVLTSNYSVAQPGVAIVLTATVTPTSTSTTESNPTGTVVFYNGTKVLGTATLAPAALSNSSTATLTIQTLSGQVTLTAYYEGDLYYDANTSNTLTITAQGFTITPDASNPPSGLCIPQGGAGSAEFDITSVGGFTGQVQVICAPPAGDDMTCTASPQQVTPTATVTFVVQTYTTSPGSGGATTLSRDGQKPLWPRRTGGAALAALVFFLLPFGKRGRKLLHGTPRCWLILLLLLAGLAGSGLGCTSNSALTSFGTPLGVATFDVTAMSNVDNTTTSQSAYFTVNVISPSGTCPAVTP